MSDTPRLSTPMLSSADPRFAPEIIDDDGIRWIPLLEDCPGPNVVRSDKVGPLRITYWLRATGQP